MFHKTYLKLAGLYLAILMTISLAFSAALYQLSAQEFDRGFHQQAVILQHGPSFGLPQRTRDDLFQQELDHLSDAKLRVLRRLAVINLLILVGGGCLCYYLARRTLQPIEESHAALERFTADASHELRTPLSAMRTETEVALMNPKLTLKEAKQKLQSNLEEVQKLTTLSDSLLRLARLEKGTLQLSPVRVVDVVARAVEQIKPLAAAKDIEVTQTVPPDLRLQGDQESVAEVLFILLDNAVKYSRPQSAIQITAQAKQDKVDINVIDEGIGIKSTELERIFERFYRADTARTKLSTGGYGLGLAIAQDILELQRGRITVRSQLAKGSTFTVSLPLADALSD